MRLLSVPTTVSTSLRALARYLCRCVPGISTSLVGLLILFAHDSAAFITLTLVLHVFVVSYTARSCYGMYFAWRSMLDTAAEHRQMRLETDNEPDRYRQIGDSQHAAPIHAILVPNYMETTETLRETLSMLASHSQSRACYEVYLAMEETEAQAEAKASALISEFSSMFKYITYTLHPQDRFGEARGKSSNLAWASRVASSRYHSGLQENVVFTAMDADTHLLSSYFETISAHCRRHGTNNYTMFVAPIVFDRNADSISPIVRCADMLWSAAGIAGLYAGSAVRTPTSVYSITMTLAQHVDFWDTGPEAIGEDLHMYLKCFFMTNGQVKSVSVFSPASHCNVEHSDVLPHMQRRERWMLSQRARFQQACRHMWGIVDSGYALKHTFALMFKKDQLAGVPDLAEKGGVDEEVGYAGEPDWAASAPPVSPSIPWGRVVVLLHRMYEAHFLPVHYFLDVVACSLLPIVTAIPPACTLSTVLIYTNRLRTAAFFGVVAQMLLYERLHATALFLRLETIRAVVDSPPQSVPDVVRESLRRVGVSRRGGWIYCLDYVLFPIAGTVFGAVPGIKAQTMQFWTTKFVYHVSSKPRPV